MFALDLIKTILILDLNIKAKARILLVSLVRWSRCANGKRPGSRSYHSNVYCVMPDNRLLDVKLFCFCSVGYLENDPSYRLQ